MNDVIDFLPGQIFVRKFDLRFRAYMFVKIDS